QSHVRVEPPEERNNVAPAPSGTHVLTLEDARAQRLRSINNWLQVRDTLDGLPGVTAVSPVIAGPGFARRGDVLKSVSLMGIDPPRYQRIIPLADDIVFGQFRVG